MINARIKEVRESLDMSQEAFAADLGLKRNSISLIENGKRNASDRTLNDISKKFNISIEWLMYGTGEMNSEPAEFSLDDYANQNKLTALEFDILKTYMELDSDVRKNLMSNLKAIFNKHDKAEIAHITSSNEPTIEELEEEYKKRHSKSVSKTEVSASNGTGGDRNKVV